MMISVLSQRDGNRKTTLNTYRAGMTQVEGISFLHCSAFQDYHPIKKGRVATHRRGCTVALNLSDYQPTVLLYWTV